MPSLGYKATCLSSMIDTYCLMFPMNNDEWKEKWKQWSEGIEHTHNALDDCREQAKVYHNFLNEVKELHIVSK